jgi:hypothetical protein
MVARTRLNVTLHLHCLFCWSVNQICQSFHCYHDIQLPVSLPELQTALYVEVITRKVIELYFLYSLCYTISQEAKIDFMCLTSSFKQTIFLELMTSD